MKDRSIPYVLAAEPSKSRTTSDHIRLACVECGKVEQFGTSLYKELKAELARTIGFEAHVCRFEAGGRCKACRGSPEKVPAVKKKKRSSNTTRVFR